MIYVLLLISHHLEISSSISWLKSRTFIEFTIYILWKFYALLSKDNWVNESPGLQNLNEVIEWLV